jgi:hypothetical protein
VAWDRAAAVRRHCADRSAFCSSTKSSGEEYRGEALCVGATAAAAGVEVVPRAEPQAAAPVTTAATQVAATKLRVTTAVVALVVFMAVPCL